jgi:hypothetical protein
LYRGSRGLRSSFFGGINIIYKTDVLQNDNVPIVHDCHRVHRRPGRQTIRILAAHEIKDQNTKYQFRNPRTASERV